MERDMKRVQCPEGQDVTYCAEEQEARLPERCDNNGN